MIDVEGDKISVTVKGLDEFKFIRKQYNRRAEVVTIAVYESDITPQTEGDYAITVELSDDQAFIKNTVEIPFSLIIVYPEEEASGGGAGGTVPEEEAENEDEEDGEEEGEEEEEVLEEPEELTEEVEEPTEDQLEQARDAEIDNPIPPPPPPLPPIKVDPK